MDLQKRDEFKPRRRDETFARRLGEALDKMGTRNAGECPDGEILATYSERGLGPEESDKWENHFAACRLREYAARGERSRPAWRTCFGRPRSR